MMYYKTINDRQVFSTCATIQLDGLWISNPTKEQIAEAGWEEYIPPVVPPSPQTEPDLEQVMEAVKKILSTNTEALSDEDALNVAALYPTWASKVGAEVQSGERLWYDGKLYKVLQSHTTQSDWTPDATPALYTEVSIEEYPEWVAPSGSETAYNTGDKVSYNGKHYESLIDGNVWSPADYPAGWKEI